MSCILKDKVLLQTKFKSTVPNELIYEFDSSLILVNTYISWQGYNSRYLYKDESINLFQTHIFVLVINEKLSVEIVFYVDTDEIYIKYDYLSNTNIELYDKNKIINPLVRKWSDIVDSYISLIKLNQTIT